MGNQHGAGRSSKHANDASDRSLVVVWCDGKLGTDTDDKDYFHTLIQLTSIVNKKRQLIHTFGELNACRDFILHAHNICLIVSGQMGMQLVPLVHQLHQVHSIYIFCMNKPKYQQWAKQYKKIRGVHTEIEEICSYLQKHFVSQSSFGEDEQLHVDVLKRNFHLPTPEHEEVPFLHAVLSKLVLFEMKLINIDDMIHYCRVEQTSTYHQQLLDDLEQNYSSNELIWWYTRDNFLQKIISRALQIHDLFTLCMMSPFVQQLSKELMALREQQVAEYPPQLDLFSGQLMSPDDLQKIRSSCGGLLCIDQFIFANSDRAVPLLYLRHQSPSAVGVANIRVLFQISIPRNGEPNVPFANIASKSQFVHEKEFLISMSSVMRIEYVEPLAEITSAWSAHMTLLPRNDPQFDTLAQYIDRGHCIDDYDLSELASSITNKLYQFKSTRKLFEQLLTSKTKHIRSILLNYDMAVIYDCLGKYDNAITAYKTAIELTRQTIPNGLCRDDLCLVPLYSNMGLSYERVNRFPHAFDHAYRALNILSRCTESSTFKRELFASTNFNLGLIHDLEKKFSEAKIYYEQALAYRREYLSQDHPDITNLQNTLTLLPSQ